MSSHSRHTGIKMFVFLCKNSRTLTLIFLLPSNFLENCNSFYIDVLDMVTWYFVNYRYFDLTKIIARKFIFSDPSKMLRSVTQVRINSSITWSIIRISDHMERDSKRERKREGTTGRRETESFYRNCLWETSGIQNKSKKE